MFGDVSIVSSVDITSSNQMLGTGKKLTLVQYSSTSEQETPASKQHQSGLLDSNGLGI
jgi:hypothetical protein